MTSERPKNSQDTSRDVVLVVDDNQDNILLLQALLEKSGFSVRTATSVAQARAVLQEPGMNVDLVLSDISMPVETGFDLLEWIRQPSRAISHIPVLLITAAMPEDENRIKGLSLGAVDYIVRPINNQELALRIRNALGHYKQFRMLRENLESSEDMAMTGRILAAANHEIRNVVGLIRITGEQALAAAERGLDMKPGSAPYQSLTALSQMTRLLTQITRDLNTHIHAEQIYTTPCDLRPLIEEVLQITQQKLQGLAVTPPPAGDRYHVLADSTRVKQILINFFLNALDAIQEKGPVTHGRLTVRITESGQNFLQIRVIDNGIGLSRAGTIKQFEPFQTTKAVRGGKGLGLWLCSRLAAAMKGSIGLESAGPGLGATAYLELPRCQPEEKLPLNIQDYLTDY